MRFLATTAAISAILASASAVRIALAPGARYMATNMTAAGNASTNGTINSFADTCSTYWVHEADHEAWLNAYCRDGTGSSPSSSLNLNQYVPSHRRTCGVDLPISLIDYLG